MTVTTKPDDEFLHEMRTADTPDYGHKFTVEELLDGADKLVMCKKCGQAYDGPADLRNNGKYCPE